MTNIPLKPLKKPGVLTRLRDYANRAVKGQLYLPPWWLRDVGGSDFEATGREFLQLFIELAHLQPDEQILDIGCGSGRMALPLTGYLNQAGSYTGIDITPESIDWCQNHITRRFSNFQFLHADLYNQRYNPQGKYQTKDYRFPFKDQSFGFIFLTSVFTHLLPEDTENYLREVCRLLRPNSLALMTFFLLNETQRHLAAQGQNSIDFRYGTRYYRTRSEITPESAVAYDEAFLSELIAQCGLQIIKPIHYGGWSGRSDGVSYQDLLLARPAGNHL